MRKFIAYTEHLFTALFRYGRPERAGIVLLVGGAAAALLFSVFLPEKEPDRTRLAEADRLNDSLRQEFFRKRAALYSPSVPAANLPTRPFSAVPGGKPTVYIELNGADSAALRTVRGIGPVISRNIVAYRSRLGGFVRKEQLKEVRGITDDNFEAISAQFFIDPAVIQKIDINFASANSLRAHPYFTGSMVNRVMQARKSKGGWNRLTELTDNDILLPDEAERVAPYVVFGSR